MTRRSMIAGALVVALVAVEGATARAQWGYPGGYGGYGWGGWGASTVGGDMARGLGAYAAGAGYYNQETAIAASINSDTVMRWNQYIYESQMESNRIYWANQAKKRAQTNLAAEQIKDRLRNNPSPSDVYRGDAMNVTFDEINNPRVYAKALEAGKVKIASQLIRHIPFQKASAAITVSIHQLTKEGPPKALLTRDFDEGRTEIKALGQKLRKEIEDGQNPDPDTINKMLDLITRAEAKVDRLLPRDSRDRVEADKFLKALHGLIAMLQTPAIDVILSGVEKRPQTTLAELLSFMNAFNLRFGVASTPDQKQAYDQLYPKLVDLRNEVGPALAATTSSTPASKGTEPGDFFQGMTYKDLQKKAPPPPVPSPLTEKP
ncbi:MAG: hypothetical protein ACP5XB_31230 [Isosphaeraceae bacterium]